MKQAADTMPAKIADNAVPVPFGMNLDRVTNIAQRIARPCLFNAQHQAFISNVNQPTRLKRNVADQIHAAGVAVPAVKQRGYVDIDDVTVLQRFVAGNTMADNMVDRDAAAMCIATIAERRGHSPARDHEIPDEIVQLASRDTGHHMRCDHVQRRCCKLSCAAHTLKAGCVMKFDRAGSGHRRLGGYGFIDCHSSDIARACGLCEGGVLGYATRMTSSSIPRIWTAALVVIGDEILSGRTQDKNVAQIAAWLNVQGIRLAEVRVVADMTDAIVEAVNTLRARNDYLFTTGGIGPTHDDITVDAIAEALGVPVVHHPRALAVLEGYYATRGGLTDARKRMARVPDGADLIENRMSGAPGIRIGNIFVMAGVPHITAGMLDALTGTLEGGLPVLSRTIGCWVAESEVADLLRHAERNHDGVAIGSYPFFREGRVGANFVVRATEPALIDACIADLTSQLEHQGRTVVADGI